MDRPTEITMNDLNDYDLFKTLHNKMNKIYRYRHAKPIYNAVHWYESTDKLRDIILMSKEHMLERVELLEEI